ncbi:uncharacterized protein LOC134811727 [Bolinopsis microptera]|uniref:uncharacterized protein LOC134811727 n=1 Tax=Bolinopsis microptera TaxID=2820187 RepID=UPI003078C82B
MDVVVDIIAISSSWFITNHFLADYVTDFSSHLIFSAAIWVFLSIRGLQKHELNVRYLYHTVCSIAAWSVVFVIFGAPYAKMDNLMSVSLLASVYTSPYTSSINFKKKESSSNPSLCIVLLFGWLGAVPMFLDWNQAWHTWPNPVIWGLTMGHIIGGIVNCFCEFD